MNILDMVKDQVTGTLASQASSFLGESEGAIQSALGAAFPAILGATVEKAASPDGAEGVMGLIKGLDLNMLGNIGNIFGGGASSVNGLLNSGGGILDLLLGNKLGGVADLIAKASGLKGGSASSLLKMASPFLLGIIGKQVGGKGITGLMDLLKGQKSNVAAALPVGMGSVLGLSSLGDLVGDIKAPKVDLGASVPKTPKANLNTNTPTSSNNKAGGLGWLKFLLPIVLIGAGLWWFFTKGGAEKTVKTAGDAVAVTKDAAGSVANGVSDAAGSVANGVSDAATSVANLASASFSKIDETAKAALDRITFTAGSAGSQILDFINGGFKGEGIFRFNNLNFATGSADLNAGANQEVDNLSAILKAYPEVKIEINGHTDNTGNAESNKQLSLARATSVMNRLVEDGIAQDRLKAFGFGSEKPVADNANAEGRAKNRRTEVKLVK